MASRFCTQCGAAMADGAAFCPGCGARAAAAAPEPAPQPQAYAPPPQAYAPPPASGGMSKGAKIGIGVAAVVAVLIAIGVQRNERDFQRRRQQQASQNATAPLNPSAQGQTGNRSAAEASAQFNAGGAVGSAEWSRNQLIGRWAETRECVNPIEIRADGSLYNGATRTGTWSYAHPRISFVETTGTTTLELVSIGTDDMVLAQNSNDRGRTWQRC